MAEEEKTEQKKGGDSFKKVYDDATYFVDSMVKEYRVFPMILGLMRDGNASIELKKRYMLRAIDETWVNIIEDTVPCLDVLIRNPSKFIEEREELMPIELSRNISPRSFQHLSQHTNLISKIEGDKITPSKILNVFREETLMTYENKFVNTLINRLYTFVSRRYEIAKKAGQDEKTTSLEFLDDFTHENLRVKMQFKMEIAESTEGLGEKAERNLTYTTDLWRRVEKLHSVVATYAASPFVQEMGHSYIRPPVMRTNAILKNKNLRQCLALWQFIESYESAGYSMLVQEDLEKVDDEYVRELYSTLALQYLIFRHNIQNEFDAENVLASDLTDEELRPRMVSELSHDKEGEYDVTVPGEKAAPDRKQPLPSMIRYGTLTPEDKMMLEALDAALDAAEIIRQGEPERPPLPEPEPEKTEEELLAEAIAAMVPPTEETADSEEVADAAAVSRQPSAVSEISEETEAMETVETAEETEAEETAETPEPVILSEAEAEPKDLPEETAEKAEEVTSLSEADFADLVASVAAEVAAEEAADAAAVSRQPSAVSEISEEAETAEETEAVEPAETTETEPAEDVILSEAEAESKDLTPEAEKPEEAPWEPVDEEAEPIEEADSGQQTADSEEAADATAVSRQPSAVSEISEETEAVETAETAEETEAADATADSRQPSAVSEISEETEAVETVETADETETAEKPEPAEETAEAETPAAPAHGTKAAIHNQKKRARRAKAKKRAKALAKKHGKGKR